MTDQPPSQPPQSSQPAFTLPKQLTWEELKSRPLVLAGAGAIVVLLLAIAFWPRETSMIDQIRRAEQAEAQNMESALAELSDPVTEEAATRPSGLEIQFIRRGKDQSTPRPSLNAAVLVHYEGSFPEGGEPFDSSFARGEPAEFPLGAVVPGFSEAIMQMRPGDEVIATFPGSLGYGPEGRPPQIPPNAALRFRIVLLAFQEPDGQLVGSIPGQ